MSVQTQFKQSRVSAPLTERPLISLAGLGKALKNVGQHWPFLLVLLLYLVSAIAYSRATPIWETPDEPSHFAYVRYIQMHGGPPIQSFQEGKNEVETGHHPPLYYYLGRWLVGQIDLNDYKNLTHNPYFRFANNDGGPNVFLDSQNPAAMPNSLAAAYSLRNLSILFGLGTLVITYLAGLLVFGTTGANTRWQWAAKGRAPATLAATFVGLLPQFGFLSGAINNDNAVVFFCSLSLYACLWLVLHPQRPRWYVFALVGALVGLGMLAKYNEITYIPVVGLAIAIVAFRSRSWKLFWQGALISGGICIAISGWWFVRAQLLYGDPAGWGMWRSSFASLDQSASFQWTGYNLKHIWSRWFDSFWGVFGWMNLPFKPQLYSWPARLMVVAGFGLALLTLAVIWPYARSFAVRKKASSRFVTRFQTNSNPDDKTAFSLIFLALSFSLVMLSAINYAATFGDAGTQGRYLFPMLTAFALGVAAGLSWLGGLVRYVPLLFRVGTGKWVGRGDLASKKVYPSLKEDVSTKSWPERVAGRLVWLLVALTIIWLGYLNVHAINDRILPAYSLPTDVSLAAVPATTTPVQGGEFAQGMELAGYELVIPTEAKPGQDVGLKLILYWRARASIKANWVGFVHVYSEGQDIGQQDGPPGKGRYQTFFWKKGEIIKDERVVSIKDYAWREALTDAQTLRFQVGWINSLTGERATLKANGQPDFYFTPQK
jgi:4-amino-4-deoxy-L-arabinose transferase-like glycosyltransferase